MAAIPTSNLVRVAMLKLYLFSDYTTLHQFLKDWIMTEEANNEMDPSKLVPLNELQSVCAELEKFIVLCKEKHPSRTVVIEKAEKCLALYKIKLARALVTGVAG